MARAQPLSGEGTKFSESEEEASLSEMGRGSACPSGETPEASPLCMGLTQAADPACPVPASIPVADRREHLGGCQQHPWDDSQPSRGTGAKLGPDMISQIGFGAPGSQKDTP